MMLAAMTAIVDGIPWMRMNSPAPDRARVYGIAPAKAIRELAVRERDGMIYGNVA
jgi:hypothetical protein